MRQCSHSFAMSAVLRCSRACLTKDVLDLRDAILLQLRFRYWIECDSPSLSLRLMNPPRNYSQPRRKRHSLKPG